MTSWAWATISLMSCALTLVLALLTRRTLRAIDQRRASLHTEAAQFQTFLRKWQKYLHAPTCEKCGRPFSQTGPEDWEHTYCPAALS